MTTVSLSWVLNFANCIVGVGLLTMPYCFQQCGIILATMMIVVSGHLTKITCEFLLRAGSYTRKSTYEQLALLVYGRSGKLMCEISTIGVTVGTLVAFQVVIGDLAPAIMTNVLGFGSSWTLRTVLMFASCALVIPLCLMRSVASLASFNAVSMTFYVCFIFVVFCLSLPSMTALEWWTDIYFWKPAEFFKCLPIILLSYNCQAQIFIFYAALPDPNMKTMMAIVHKAINVVNMFYISVGMFGYIAFYKSGVHGDVLENFPTGFLTDLMKLGFLLSIIVSFPLMCFPVRSSINSLLFADKKQGILHDVITNSSGYIAPEKFVIITFGLVFSTVVIGILVPKIEVVLSITGALAGTFICLVFPSALFLMAGAKDKLRSFGLAVLLVSAFLMITCTTTSLSGIIYGEPPPAAPIENIVNIVKTGIDVQVGKLPAATIATIAKLESRGTEDKKVLDKDVVLDNKINTHISPAVPKIENRIDIEIKKVSTEITKKVEEEKVVSSLVDNKSDVKQISDLNNALHGKGNENIQTNHQQQPSLSVDKVKKDLVASEVPTLSKVIVTAKKDSVEKTEVDSQIKKDAPDKKDVADISKDAHKVLNISNNGVPLAETPLEIPLEIPSVLKIDESERKTKVNREILSKQ